MIRTLTVGQMAANCYLIMDPVTHQAFIVDPGDDAEYIEKAVSDAGAKPSAIIATHGHFDHIMAVRELEITFRIPFFIHHADVFLLDRMSASARHFLGFTPDLPAPDSPRTISSEETMQLGTTEIRILEVPGHTPGSIALYCPSEGFAVVGDLMFKDGGVGRTDFAYGDPKKLADSIGKIVSLPSSTVLYCGHGKETTVAAELAYFRHGV